MGCCGSAPADRVLPEPPATTEYDTYVSMLNESLDPGNPRGWTIKKDWPTEYRKDGFKIMRIALRPHESGNANMLLRADGKFKGARPHEFADFLKQVEVLPGFQESFDAETLPDGSIIKYLRVKAPCLTARDHCWKYTFEKRGDGSIFACIRTTTHDKCPPRPGVIRAYYHNASLFKMSTEEEGVMEMTEFIFQDLKGGLSPSLMNSALAPGTLQANAMEMKHLAKKRSRSS